ncbi:MAG: hypothetical protein IJD92_03910 [Bacilli bacterium]|nr:hypothetical protein [Bacilli bacterium]
MEEFFYEESNTKHNFLKILVLLFIIGIFIGIFIYYRKVNSIKLKNITIEAGETLSKNVEDYLVNGEKNKDKYNLDISKVNTNKVGSYTYTVKHNKHIEKAIIKVVDTTSPNVTLENITIGPKEELDPNLLISSCNDISLPCRASFTNDSDIDKLKNVGTYNISITVSDNVFNTIKKYVTITVKEGVTFSNTITNDINYYSNSENDTTLGHTLFYKFDKAVIEDSHEYEEKIREISVIEYDLYLEKEIHDIKLITAYNKYGYVIGIQVEVTYIDGVKELLSEQVIYEN